jgi:hypothetical protein
MQTVSCLFRYHVPVHTWITKSEVYDILACSFHLTGDVFTTDISQQQVYITNIANVKR